MKKENKEQNKIKGQIMRGRVVMAKLPKTVTVLVESTKTHPLYKKTYKRSKKYLVHDEIGVTLGDVVEVIKIKPMSKNKHFKIGRVIGKDIEAVVSKQLKEQAEKIIAEVMPKEPETGNQKPEAGSEKLEKVEKEVKPKAKKIVKREKK